ncbi:MAG TPA: protein kinase [Bryobacteraceae bacterium]|nr:protein kinase [Bryobacteraceae bacterium]
MGNRSRSNDRALTLVEEALARPEDEREAYLRELCGLDEQLFAEAWSYVIWEKRMQGFLVDPLRPAVDVQPAFKAGQMLINRFRVVREVARGGMGIVWEAHDEKLDRRVALKCAQAGFGKQLPPEARNAREISHPNVCKIFEIHTASTPDGEVDFISMEFLDGETLADRLLRTPLGHHEAGIIAQQLCSGLAEAHRNHLVHGDLKSNNVILASDSQGMMRAVITDFGLARKGDSSAALVGGTPAYMAPELWKGEKPSIASDVYALGVLLWEIRSGRLPGRLGRASSTLALGERLSLKPPPGRGKWSRLIARCLDPEPARRYGNAAEVAVALGPSQKLKRLRLAAAAALVAAASGVITYQRATAPAETVRLALLPFTATQDSASFSERLLHNTATELARLKGTPHTRFRFIPLDKGIRNRVNTPEEARVLLGASHALRAVLEREGTAIKVHAYVTDLRSGVDAREWEAEYKSDEMGYAPAALAGVVTETLHLPPPTSGAQVNDRAREDYRAGLAAVRRGTTLDQALDRFRRAGKEDTSSALPLAGLAETDWFEYAVTQNKVWVTRAADAVLQAQVRNPDLPEVHRIAGLLKSYGGFYAQATSEYLRAIELDPGNGDAYRRLGETYQYNGQNEEALTAFKKALAIDPQEYRNSRDLGRYFFQRARYDEAIVQFRKAIKLGPGDPGLRYELTEAYQDAGQFTLAEKEIRGCLRSAETPIALDALGVLLIYEGKYQEALSNILLALRLDDGQYLLWMNLGIAYGRLGLPADCARSFRRALELAETELASNPRDALIRARVANLCARQNEQRRAASELAQALREASNDAEVLWIAAVTYEALGRRNDTLSILATAPAGVVADLGRWPEMADLQRDPRFLSLMANSRR